MSGEIDFVGGAKLDHLYPHLFGNGAGKFFNILTEEDGSTTLEYDATPERRNRIKMTLTFIRNRGNIDKVVFKKFKHYKNDGWQEQWFDHQNPFEMSHMSFERLVAFLKILSELDLANVNERRIPLLLGNGTGFDPSTARTFRTMILQPDGQAIIRELLASGEITASDISNISRRKKDLKTFQILLTQEDGLAAYAAQFGLPPNQPEKVWQHFFKNNEWIFGFGLDYRFLGLLQNEAHVGMSDVAGTNSAIGDFLMGAENFTVLVEVKRPDTPLFARSQNRANSWRLSHDLVDSVSQILEQKAIWQIKSETNANNNHDRNGNLIRQRTVDPKAILIIGSDNMFNGSEKERAIKEKTFELFRRDSRNIELVTYDELFKRAIRLVGNAEGGQGS